MTNRATAKINHVGTFFKVSNSPFQQNLFSARIGLCKRTSLDRLQNAACVLVVRRFLVVSHTHIKKELLKLRLVSWEIIISLQKPFVGNADKLFISLLNTTTYKGLK